MTAPFARRNARERALARAVLSPSIMATSFLGIALGVVVTTAAVSYGCAARPTTIGTTELTSARTALTTPAVLAASNVEPVAPTMERDDEVEAPTAVLLVRGDVASRCLGLGLGAPPRGTSSVPAGHAGGRWREVLEQVTTCMKTGALRGEHLIVKGDAKERAAVRCILGKMGIPESRVELLSATEAKVEIATTSPAAAADVASSLTLPIEKSSVVAFLSDDNLD